MAGREKAPKFKTAPQSSKSGIYSIDKFTLKELSTIEKQTKEILGVEECAIPLVPRNIINSAVEWYAHFFINQLLLETKVSSGKPSLNNFKSVAEDYGITYNLKGAEWFKNLFKHYCLKILKNNFSKNNINSIKDTNLNFIPIKVTSSSGNQEFDVVTIKKWFDPKKLKILSLDDIGDRGDTQETIRKRVLEEGAINFTSVNLTQKMVPGDVSKEKKQTAWPDFGLLEVIYAFLLGFGLDDGVREETREFKSIVQLCDDIPQFPIIFFQGGLR